MALCVDIGTKVGENKNLFILLDGKGHHILRFIHGTQRQPHKIERRIVPAEAYDVNLKNFKSKMPEAAGWDGEVQTFDWCPHGRVSVAMKERLWPMAAGGVNRRRIKPNVT